MSINSLKKALIGKIVDTNDEEVLRVVYRLLDQTQEVYQLSAEEQQIVEEAQAEYKKGNAISDEDLQKELDKWLNA